MAEQQSDLIWNMPLGVFVLELPGSGSVVPSAVAMLAPDALAMPNPFAIRLVGFALLFVVFGAIDAL